MIRRLKGPEKNAAADANQAENIAKTIERLDLVLAPSGRRPDDVAFLDYEKQRGGIAFTM